MGKCIVHFIPAKAGDCILLELDYPHCILIDCGFRSTYAQVLKPLLLHLNNLGYRVSLMIISHMDCDHIEGAISFLQENGLAENPKIIPVDNIWFNGFFNTLFNRPEFDARRAKFLSEDIAEKMRNGLRDLKMQMSYEGQISAKQCKSFEELCAQGGYLINKQFADGIAKSVAQNREEALEAKILIAGCEISVLGPSETQLERLAKQLDRDMICWFGRDYNIIENEDFTQFFELLMKLYEEPLALEMISAFGTSLESWLNTSTRAPMNEVNRSSIVVEINYQGKKMLFTGDGESEDWANMIAPKYDLIKLSHHGTTKPNLALLEKSVGERILISTNGGKNMRHPEDELLARVILKGMKKLYFNYDIRRKKQLIEFQNPYGFSAHFGEPKIVL